jgi:L-alanine-DL-glutamate epimerase-like enolase superfamily enzyme
MLGGRSNRIRAYASSRIHRPVEQMVQLARHLLERGYPALKLWFGRPSLEEYLAVIAAIRDSVGHALELMVDCNQGWRMPWDVQQPWNQEKAVEVAGRLEAEQVFWMEEPLHRGDYRGYSELKQHVSIRIAGGEMTREPYESASFCSAAAATSSSPTQCAAWVSAGSGSWPSPSQVPFSTNTAFSGGSHLGGGWRNGIKGVSV